MAGQTSKVVVVAGGTGNVGSHVVQGLLSQGDTVVVPSRSPAKIDEFMAYLARHVDEQALRRVRTFVGDLTSEKAGEALVGRIEAEVGVPSAVFASLGHFRPSGSLLATARGDLEAVVEDYLYAHLAVAQRFLRGLASRGGTYVLVNGPLAFEISEGSALVSIATAAQHMLFKALVRELDGSKVRVVELVNYAFVRDRQTQPSSALSAEAFGAYAASLVSNVGHGLHGRSIHVRNEESLAKERR